MIKQFYFKLFNLACHLFGLSFDVKQFYLIHASDSDTTSLSQRRPGSNVIEGVLRIPQSFNITGALLSDCLI